MLTCSPRKRIIVVFVTDQSEQQLYPEKLIKANSNFIQKIFVSHFLKIVIKISIQIRVFNRSNQGVQLVQQVEPGCSTRSTGRTRVFNSFNRSNQGVQLVQQLEPECLTRATGSTRVFNSCNRSNQGVQLGQQVEAEL